MLREQEAQVLDHHIIDVFSIAQVELGQFHLTLNDLRDELVDVKAGHASATKVQRLQLRLHLYVLDDGWGDTWLDT